MRATKTHRAWKLGASPLVPTILLLLLGLACNGQDNPSPEKDTAGVHEPAESSDLGRPAKTGLEILAPSASILSEMGALYLEVTNHDASADRLIRVETAAAESAEIHLSTEVDGVVRMRHQPDGLEIPGGSTLQLRQGGSHIMLLGAKLPAVDPVPVTLFFEQAGAMEIEVPLASLDQMGGGENHGSHDGHDGAHADGGHGSP